MIFQKHLISRLVVLLISGLGLLGGELAYARHGEVTFLSNRIPEPAAYEVSETTAAGYPNAPHNGTPFESLWTGIDDVGSCDGCHTTVYDQWNGSMMANAWRDPGWRGAFLLVARLTSTDGCSDIKAALSSTGKAPDGTQGYDCSVIDPAVPDKLRSINPFAKADGTSVFKIDGANTVTYKPTAANPTNSGSLMDDFCSRCHMPTNYIDATTSVTYETAQGKSFEHGGISPTYDPTSINTTPGFLVTTTDPFTGPNVPVAESYATRFDGNRPVNSNSGKEGIVCEICHTNVASRHTPYHYYSKSDSLTKPDYYAATKNVPRWDTTNQRDQFGQPLSANHQDMLYPPDDATSKNLGYGIAAGAFRLSPHALNLPERFGPLTWNDFTTTIDPYLSGVFVGSRFPISGLPTDGKLITVTDLVTSTSTPIYFTRAAHAPGKHDTFYQAKMERAEMCAACHDVTNPLTIKNDADKWVGGFPIERTYTEYLSSRYANRPGNDNYDKNYKRDCQTCHMQQTYGQPGTALTLYTDTRTDSKATPNPVTNAATTPVPPLDNPSCDRVLHNPGFSHHFVGGNAYITKMIGTDVSSGTASPYPELLHTSFSSTDETSRFHYARFTPLTTGRRGPAATQHQRFAWDRLRNALTMTLSTPTSIPTPTAALASTIPITGVIINEGAGHNFPTGFPEGRAAWVRVVAWDTRNGTVASPYDMVGATLTNGQYVGGKSAELEIQDSTKPVGNQLSLGVGYLTAAAQTDPTYANCSWKIPEASPDPYAITFKAVASKDGLCPTLELPYASAKNMVVNNTLGSPAFAMPIDATNKVIDRTNPDGIPQYTDTGGYLDGVWSTTPNGNGDKFDDSFLRDTRLQPMKGAGAVNPYATASLARYSVVVPTVLKSGLSLVGPIAITATVYYQSFEAVVAKDFLGSLANLDDLDRNEGNHTDTNTAAGEIRDPATGQVYVLINGVKVYHTPTLEPCVLNAPCDRIGKPGITGEIQLRDAMKFDPVVVDGAPPVPVIVKSQVTRLSGATDTVAPHPIINNSSGSPNTTAPIPFNRHWSPSPYGGAAGNYPVEGIGEQGVDPARVVKISFSEPVTGVNENTLYLTTSRGVSIPALLNQIDDTTWALFPYSTATQTFLSASTNIIHVAPTRVVGGVTYTIRDYSPVIAADGKAGNVLLPGPTTTPLSDVNQYTFGFKIM